MRHLVVIGGLALLPACPDDPAANPPVLWLALDGGETEVRLIGERPDPF